MDANSTSFSSPLASPQNVNVNIPLQLEYVVDAISHASFWTVLWTVLAVAVVYDQSMFYPQSIAAKEACKWSEKSRKVYKGAGGGEGSWGHCKTRGFRTEFSS